MDWYEYMRTEGWQVGPALDRASKALVEAEKEMAALTQRLDQLKQVLPPTESVLLSGIVDIVGCMGNLLSCQMQQANAGVGEVLMLIQRDVKKIGESR